MVLINNNFDLFSLVMNSIKNKIQQIYQFIADNSQRLAIILIVLSLICTFSCIIICSFIPNIFATENLVSFISVSAPGCQFKPASLNLFLDNLGVQVQVLLALSITKLTILIILLFLVMFPRKGIKGKRIEDCILFVLILLAISLTGRSNSLRIKINEVSQCQTNTRNFQNLIKSSRILYTISWVIMLSKISFLIFCFSLSPDCQQQKQKIKIPGSSLQVRKVLIIYSKQETGLQQTKQKNKWKTNNLLQPQTYTSRAIENQSEEQIHNPELKQQFSETFRNSNTIKKFVI